ncbi:MAG TPA: restriction endonuclease [Thermoflexales bacterium]|nr:restriction endonuclease [Thermoflexales bacterium]HQW36299.1 restriction endonuclease [Thermoflexales bacterium]HQZ22282.1 restriction endonuclease [Thermoflexales bacterium]
MQVNPNLNPITNPAALCLGLPILGLFIFLFWAGYALAQESGAKKTAGAQADEILRGAGVDVMTISAFRSYIGQKLAAMGYTLAPLPPGEEDLGMSLIAAKAGRRVAVFVVRSGKPLSPRMAQEANALKARAGCDEAWLVTNSSCRKDTRALAAQTGCKLMEREALAEWLTGSKQEL